MLRKLMPAILPAALAFAVGAATYAKADQPKVPAQAAPMSPNMMQGGGMMGGGNMSGSGDMKGMGDMNGKGDMMGQMMQMMSLCSQMMQSAMQHPTTPEQPGPSPKGGG